MLRFIGLIAISVVLSAAIYFLEIATGGSFVKEVLEKDLLSIMGTILGLNLTAAAFLVAKMADIESEAGKIYFDGARKEIKENLYLMLVLFIGALILLSVGSNALTVLCEKIDLQQILTLVLLFLYLYAFFELIKAVFSISVPIIIPKNKKK